MARWLAGLLGRVAAVATASPFASGCRSVVPLAASTRFGERPATEQELVLGEPCTLLPGRTPMGRPEGVHSHTLPAGRYGPALQDGEGIYFASPRGVSVTAPAPRGTRVLAGGVYVAHDRQRAWEYLGDEANISAREPLPERCRFQVEPKQAP